ncbi:MAG: single-stranded DNA-binding protein [Pseudomonas sp. PGPPP4]|jgi:single-strand DNA-binding protein|uniref:single-stranded DNA-binding protein n=1 Tax=Pseudomonas TaxID=286 RepID=UPI0005C9462E|nr:MULTISPECIES: single-stranded DNA-binding protein [Pseudomonas]KIZ52727.1 single-stranded DNA-binding protein [Pseudomonas oryzihabitans]OYT79108.1 MAG: single-stranded DNA-binding protein [Pseudomonas sp. PGPPP4]
MGTAVVWEGNIGSAPEYKRFQKDNQDPRHLLRLNVYFDNSIRLPDSSYEDRGGFWANVELWHRDAENYSRLYQKGMRVLIEGRAVLDTWKDGNGVEQAAMKVQANRIAFLPQRIESITLGQGTGQSQARPAPSSTAPARAPASIGDDFDDQIPY